MASFLVLCGYLGNSPLTAVLLLTLAVSSQGMVYSGFFINHMDIAPRYSGLLIAITNTIGSLSGFMAPAISKAMTPKVRKHH